MKYRADIDGLRAIAILLVTVFHFDLFSLGKAGFIGVDVFFVISGFLITTILVKDLEARTFHFGHFLLRRVRRLYPAMLSVLSLYLVVAYFLFLPDSFLELAREVALSQVYVINFYFWRTVDYFGLQADTVPLLHMWSLAVEEQFYIFFPIFCFLVWKKKPSVLLPLLILLTLLSFLLGFVMSSWKPWASFYLLPTRAWELLAGCVLALVLPRLTGKIPVAGLLGSLGLILIGASLYLHTPATLIPGWFSLLPVIGTVLLIIAGQVRSAWTTRLLSLRPFVWIGLISYPLYVVHWPIMILLKESVPSFDLTWRIFGFALSFFLGWAIYKYVEQPLRHGHLIQTTRSLVVTSMSATALLFGAALLVVSQQGMPQRFAPDIARYLAYQNDDAKRFRSCEGVPYSQARATCRLGTDNAPPDVLIFGDSHANAFARSIDLWLNRTGQTGLFTFRNSCLPVSNLGRTDCVRQFEEVLAYAQKTPSIRTVYMISIWRQPYQSSGMVHSGIWVPKGEIEDVFVQELEASVAAFIAAGKDVVLVDPFYSSSRNAPRTLAINAAFGRNWGIDRSLAGHKAQFEKLFEAFLKMQAIGAKRISLIEEYCLDAICSATYQGRPIFTDNNHLADHMSERMSYTFEAQRAPESL